MNYRHFFMFLVYMAIGSMFVVVFSLGPFLAAHDQMGRKVRGRSGILLMFCLSTGVGIAVAGMAVWHGVLIATNSTTIEFYQNAGRRRQALLRGGEYTNPYDLGSIDRNWAQVLGAPFFSLRWLLPSWSPPHGNGMEWRVRRLGEDGFMEPDETSGLRPEMRGWGTFFSGDGRDNGEEGDRLSGDEDENEDGNKGQKEVGLTSGRGDAEGGDSKGHSGGNPGRESGTSSRGLLDEEGAPTGLGQWLGGVTIGLPTVSHSDASNGRVSS